VWAAHEDPQFHRHGPSRRPKSAQTQVLPDLFFAFFAIFCGYLISALNLCVFAPLREILVLVPGLCVLRRCEPICGLSSDLDRLKPCGRIGDLILGSDELDLFSVPFRG
jgi:hypothetical protein